MTIVGRMCRLIRPVSLCWIAASVLGGIAWPAKGHDPSGPLQRNESLQFDIPAQPLDSALKAYSIATGIEVFYNAALVELRMSQNVVGGFTPTLALQKLLEKTEFTPQLTPDGALTIVLQQAARRSADEIVAQRRRYEGYLAAMQAEISTALCAAPVGVAGSEDILLRIWLTANGGIARAEIFDKPASQADRIATLVGRANAGAPPAGMPQPVTLAIFPPSISSSECRRASDNAMARERFAPPIRAAQ